MRFGRKVILLLQDRDGWSYQMTMHSLEVGNLVIWSSTQHFMKLPQLPIKLDLFFQKFKSGQQRATTAIRGKVSRFWESNLGNKITRDIFNLLHLWHLTSHQSCWLSKVVSSLILSTGWQDNHCHLWYPNNRNKGHLHNLHDWKMTYWQFLATSQSWHSTVVIILMND